ncbi:preprotein translocase subunit YajC [Brachybacterium sp. YJGR34]|uniref:preprotein translocase subunit YajC n=1 Tax=Brachybacterium sp. YJGR34 TaxID=2059911 RepID=UPI001E41CF8B|nr:preprotein translocase subunit YajC [Brachybacterium sp. YJGR34]
MESFLPLLLIFAVMMLPLLFMSNRQKKAQRKQMELINQLGVGDEVRTHSGFYGLIVESFDDVVVLESEDGSQTKWARQAIAMKADGLEPAVAEGEDAVEEQDADEQDAEHRDDVPGVTVSEDPARSDDDRKDR